MVPDDPLLDALELAPPLLDPELPPLVPLLPLLEAPPSAMTGAVAPPHATMTRLVTPNEMAARRGRVLMRTD